VKGDSGIFLTLTRYRTAGQFPIHAIAPMSSRLPPRLKDLYSIFISTKLVMRFLTKHERKRSTMTKTFKIEKPKIRLDLHPAQFEDIYYDEDPMLSDCEVKHAFVEGEELNKLVLSRVSFKGVRLLNSSFRRADVTDTVFDNCDLSNTRFEEGILHRVHFKDCKLLGLDLSQANLKNVTFENCILNISSFIDAKLKQVLFEKSTLQTANFYDCHLEKATFDRCDLNDIDFTVTNLNGIDISSSFFERIRIEGENLRGCIVSPQQAVSFASVFGLKVKE
jgi:uncharacterized protein YjbI with pentapeptide repeats